jgi:Glu-tRNA(Gln) amidotransferase subunit E-like FAD-binding protein
MNSTRHYLVTIALSAATVTIQPLAAQSRQERKAQQVAESAAPKNVAGGTTFRNPTPIEMTFENIANELKREGHSIDRADKDAGQIITAMEIEGGYSQTGTRILVTLIKDNDNQTTVRVVVTKQKRKKLLQTEPWSDPKADNQESQQTADALRASLKG